jgi:hypothetical protein
MPDVVRADEPSPDLEGDAVSTPSQPEPRPLRRGRGVALIGLRVAAGTVGIGVAAVAIVAAGLLPIPRIQVTPSGTVVTPVPAAREIVCPGSVLRLGDQFGQDATTPGAIGRPSVAFGSTGADVETSELVNSDAGTGGTPSAPRVLGITPSESAGGGESGNEAVSAALIAGAQSEAPSAPEFTGLAAASCQGASSETWLVGGSTDVGRTTLVTLANSSDVASSVAIEIFSEDGEIVSAGAAGIMVQPRGQRVLSLAGFAPAILSPVIRVTSRGGQIVANLQQATVRGLDAGGVDIVGASAKPASVQVIPGVVVNRSLAVSQSLGAQGFEDLAPVIRLLVPGDVASIVTLTVAPDGAPAAGESPGGGTDADGEAPNGGGPSFSVEVAAGRVIDVPVELLGDGVYTVTVTSAEPVIAGARVSTVSASSSAGAVSGSATRRPASSDFAWFSAATLLGTESIVSVASGSASTLHLHNPESAEVTVRISSLEGVERDVVIAAGGSASVEVDQGSTMVLSGFGALYASVSFVGDAQLAAYTVDPPAAASSPITIFVK